MQLLQYFIVGILSILSGGVIGFIIRYYIAKSRLNSAENKAEMILKESKIEAESQKKELLLDAKTYVIQERNNFEKETKERRIELQRLEKRLIQKEIVNELSKEIIGGSVSKEDTIIVDVADGHLTLRKRSE